MRKSALAFLISVISAPAFANIHINPDTVVSVVQAHVPAEKVNPVIREYHANIKASNGAGIAADKLWNVCAAAGWNIEKEPGKQKCQTFVTALVKSAVINYYRVCTDNGSAQAKKAGVKPYCIDDFFSNSFYGGTQVGVAEGIQLAKEYARIKHGDDSLQCNEKPRKIKVVLGATDYVIQCSSKNKNAAYEFVFDDLEESSDKTHHDDVQKAVCKLHDAAATTAGCTGGGTNVSAGTITCWDASCAANAAKCNNINQSMFKFGYAAKYKSGKCVIDFNTIRDAKELKTAFGIDNFEPCKWDMQAQNAADLEKQIKKFIAGKAGVSATSVRCDAGFKTYTGAGCMVNGIADYKDDIKTCYVGNAQIDLVFNDLNEMSKDYHDAAVEGLRCLVAGGSPSGERCVGLGRQQCNIIKAAQLSDCPECKSVYWDTKTQSCVTPAGSAANNLKKGVNIALLVGGTIAGVVVTVATAGSAGAPVVAFLLTAIELEGARIEITSQLQIDGIADEFLVKSNQCKSASCAETLLKQHLQRMVNYAGEMTRAENEAVDDELVRLNELIPATSQFYTDIVAGESITEANAKSSLLDLDSWEREQIWRAVGIGMQLTSVFTSVGKLVLGKTGMLARKLPHATDAITAKAKASRTALKQKLARGEKVKLSNGNEISVPKSKLAADDIVELDGKTYKINSDGSFTLLNEDKNVVQNATKNTVTPSESLSDERNRLEMEIFDTPERFSEVELAAKKARLEIVNKELETAPKNTSVQDMMKRFRNKSKQETPSVPSQKGLIPDFKESIDPSVIEDPALRHVYQQAYDAEKIITNDMVEIARKSGGELSGLEYRMKTPESMMGKIARDREAGEVAKGISDAEVASRFSDIVRYTQTGSTETLTQQVGQTLSELEAKGYKINKVKNRFDTAAGEYKDMMVQLEHSQTGQKVELQFNTPKNLELKEKGHKFYEITRDKTKTPEEREVAQKAMEEIYKQLEVPDGISGFVY